jgi:hypothetical protein
VEGGGVRNGKMVENLGMEGMFGNGGQSGLGRDGNGFGSGGKENEGNGGKPGKFVKACLVVLACKRFLVLAAWLKLMLEKLKAKKKITMKDFFEAMVKNEEGCCKICQWKIWFEIVYEVKGECLVNIYRVRVKLI